MGGRWLLLAAVAGVVVATVSSEAAPSLPMSGETSVNWNGCLFVAGYHQWGKQLRPGPLTFRGGVTCSTPVPASTDVTVVDGLAAPVQAVTGDNVAGDGVDGPVVGTVLWHRNTYVEDGQALFSGSLPRPAVGHVYTILTTTYFSDPCGGFGDPCELTPPPGPRPGAVASLTDVGSECTAGRYGTMDVFCSYEFTVLGTAVP